MLIHTKFLLSPNLPNLAFAGVPTIHVKTSHPWGHCILSFRAWECLL